MPEPYVPALSLSRDQPIMLLFYPLCYAAVLLKFTYYAQEQELWSDYYAIYAHKFAEEQLITYSRQF